MLKGRLGLETGRIPHADRHGLLWLGRGRLYVDGGTIRFATPGCTGWPAGDYSVPVQNVSCLLLEPGVVVTHDVFRIAARQGTGVVIVGEGGVRLYASMPKAPDDSTIGRRHVAVWSDPERRLDVARRMYAMRFGEVLPAADLNVLRGIEAGRVKAMYKSLAEKYGINWTGRRYDRSQPERNDHPNNAINHASVAVTAAAEVAVAAVGAIPQLGFIHEHSGYSFCLDIADLYRADLIVAEAFAAVAEVRRRGGKLEEVVRRRVGAAIRKRKIVSDMIDRIQELLNAYDRGGDQGRV